MTYITGSASAWASPLAEGRELKWLPSCSFITITPSPLAEGRELKFFVLRHKFRTQGRPSRRGVN